MDGPLLAKLQRREKFVKNNPFDVSICIWAKWKPHLSEIVEILFFHQHEILSSLSLRLHTIIDLVNLSLVKMQG